MLLFYEQSNYAWHNAAAYEGEQPPKTCRIPAAWWLPSGA